MGINFSYYLNYGLSSAQSQLHVGSSSPYLHFFSHAPTFWYAKEAELVCILRTYRCKGPERDMTVGRTQVVVLDQNLSCHITYADLRSMWNSWVLGWSISCTYLQRLKAMGTGDRTALPLMWSILVYLRNIPDPGHLFLPCSQGQFAITTGR